MSLYLDASVLVALFTNDALSERADALVARAREPFIVSDFTRAETSAAIGKKVRVGKLTAEQALAAFQDFDLWSRRNGSWVDLDPEDMIEVVPLVRRLELKLRAPDALHVTMARRLRASIATFDEGLAEAAKTVGLAVVT